MTINLHAISPDLMEFFDGDEKKNTIGFQTKEIQDTKLYSSGATHGPIKIDGGDWDASCDCVVGNGTKNNPYFIANLTIEGGGLDGIFINNSEAYGIIYNCTIIGGKNGIFMSNTSNCNITQNIIANCSEEGIFCIKSSSNCFIEENEVKNSEVGGITIFLTSGMSLNGNRIYNNTSNGISLIHVSDSVVKNNYVSTNNGTGISLDVLLNISIADNRIVENIADGCLIFDSKNVNISRNTISNNIGVGIGIYRSEFCIVSTNVVKFNYFSGINFGFFLNHSQIYNNKLHKNRVEGIPNRGVNNSIFDNQFISIIIPSFVVSKTLAVLNETLSFTDTSQLGYLPLHYLWEFGDGAFSTDQNPNHTYTEIGEYTVFLTVIDSDSDEASFQMEIAVVAEKLPTDTQSIRPSISIITIGYIIGVSFLLIAFVLVMIRRKKMQFT